MEFLMDVNLIIEGSGVSTGGYFFARKKSEIPKVAYQFIQDKKRESGCRKMVIKKVIVNGSEDITQVVKEIESRPIPQMDDIYW
ncbi:hypothetical protein PH210_28595 [Paenibacillus sp. BSR1-1]|uniref:hypothetical protein n=1 Tax=Paenibacillus sp. BSR1-1 TaxID=3020845 RepID=UPI0025AF036E|nr:hypothetical protein [Paenibacillus sp. BSR1-1]MDN3020105.1 hypothetical protein [Paenibacillus sp. BSR1-1]